MTEAAVNYWESMQFVHEFEVTDEHLALLQRGHIGWHYVNERVGSPGLDTKRPFGSSDVWHSIAKAVDGAFLNAMGEGARDDYIEANAGRWERLLAEVGIALQNMHGYTAIQHRTVHAR
jgi:hypothetical protein